jgi:3-oxoacyl-[acyl-carrier-protein] synthase-3
MYKWLRTMIRSKIIGWGSYLPANVVKNEYFATELKLDTSDEWIKTRTGIKERCFAAEGEFTSDLALHAARNAIEIASISLNEIDLIIVATTTPDYTFPSTAVILQEKLGIKRTCAFDIQAVCSGFVFGLVVGDNYIKSGTANNVLIVGAETMSRLLNYEDRSTSILFGDGAGAVILSRENATTDNRNDLSFPGIISSTTYTNSSGIDKLKTSGGISMTKTAGYIEMQGIEVFRYAVESLTQSVKDVVKLAGISIDRVDKIVPHQANKRIVSAVASSLNLSEDKVVYTGEYHANTSAASVPLAFDVAMRRGEIKKGDVVVFTAIGAGFTVGSVLVVI